LVLVNTFYLLFNQFLQNLWGSENTVIAEFIMKGYCVSNPCFDIQIVHEHASELRDERRNTLKVVLYSVKPGEKGIRNKKFIMTDLIFHT